VLKAQLTLTVPEAKALIAEAIADMKAVQAALGAGKVLLKGGTTVAAVAKRMANTGLRISGRISPQGTKSSKGGSGYPHSILIEAGQIKNIDTCFSETVVSLKRDDVVIIGANALDSAGKAAMMLGSPLGGKPGQGLAGIMAQGCKVIIACGLEKLIPGSIDDAIRAAGIFSIDWSMGMATGLTPLVGEVITEQTALEILSGVRCTVIAAGGIAGAEGSTTMIVEGQARNVEQAVQAVLAVKGAVTSGCAMSLEECSAGSEGCAIHQQCAWRKAKGEMTQWQVKLER
jgi:hypothetical protein